MLHWCVRFGVTFLVSSSLSLVFWLQMFPPMLVGAALVVATPQGHLDPSYVVKLLIQHQVNEFIFSVPTMVSCCYAIK